MGSLPLFVAVREGNQAGQQERDQLVLVHLTALNMAPLSSSSAASTCKCTRTVNMLVL
jgi:hypothetical protein